MSNKNFNQSKSDVTLGLLKAVHKNESITQRSIARDLGIALGLVNTYLKRCVKTGLIKINQAPSSRYAYYLTPKGFAEKSRLTATYLSQSMSFFRLVRVQSDDILRYCDSRGWRRIALVGKTELCEITILGAADFAVDLIAVIDAEAARSTSTFMNIPVHSKADDVKTADAFLITDMKAPQETYDGLIRAFTPDRILVIPFLGIHQQSDEASAVKERTT